jgi:hypothetical protein
MPKAAERGNVSPRLMPRWASRITLEITKVRVQRLQEISETDCVAEGCAGLLYGSTRGYNHSVTPKQQYHWLWSDINGPEAWEANPWVWVVEFNRVQILRAISPARGL